MPLEEVQQKKVPELDLLSKQQITQLNRAEVDGLILIVMEKSLAKIINKAVNLQVIPNKKKVMRPVILIYNLEVKHIIMVKDRQPMELLR